MIANGVFISFKPCKKQLSYVMIKLLIIFFNKSDNFYTTRKPIVMWLRKIKVLSEARWDLVNDLSI